MPNFNANLVVPTYGPGMSGQLFNAETPSAPQASQSLKYIPIVGHSPTKTWGVKWTTIPSAAVVTLQSSNTNIDADFADILTFTFSGDALPPQTEVGCSTYYRYALKSNTGGSGLTANFQFS